MRARPLALLFILSLLIGCGSSEDKSPAARPVTADRIVNADSEPGNSLSHGRTYDEQRFSAEEEGRISIDDSVYEETQRVTTQGG